MSSRRPADRLAVTDLVANRSGLFPFLVLSAWCGLVSGLLEVGVIMLRKRTLDFNHLYWMSRHFVWLIPLINLAIFLVLGLVLSIVILCTGQRGRWLAARALCGLAVLPPVWVAFPRIYGLAGFVLALGIAVTAGPGTRAACRGLTASGPGQLSGRRPSRTDLGGLLLVSDQVKAWRERGAGPPALGFSQHPSDRHGYGGGRPPEPPRL